MGRGWIIFHVHQDEPSPHSISIFLASSGNSILRLVEHSNIACDARHMVLVVSMPCSHLLSWRLALSQTILHRSFILYIVCVMTLAWRTGTTEDVMVHITPLVALGPRIAITGTVLIGLVYLYLVIREFRLYGNAMDEKWKSTLNGFKNPQNYNHPDVQHTNPEGIWISQQSNEFPIRTRQNLRPHESRRPVFSMRETV